MQQQEVNLVQQRKMVMGEERAALNKEISALQERLANNSQDLKVGRKTNMFNRPRTVRYIIQHMECCNLSSCPFPFSN